ncbi:hypothetical protein L3X38_008010 [Prunus dulcis]|uniref:Uncharacterized protein n=1 Tax=Prunus dulcis TaxID=3755 RepID=A0AAD5F6Q4_PRUDU|nr:hypothetical protein L3X38_008010 [Prunus dulcis]
MFARLSPSCILIWSFNFTYQTLARSKKSFIEILDNEIGVYDKQVRARYPHTRGLAREFRWPPRTYEASEVGPDLITALRNDSAKYGVEKESGNGSDWSVIERRDTFLFARKFTPDAIGPLMIMANDVIFKD